MASTSDKWRVLGVDGFEMVSDPTYFVGEYDTEQDALACASSLLRRSTLGTIRDGAVIVKPDGEHCRCVLDYCPICKVPDAMETTGKGERPKAAGQSELEHVCKHCGYAEWREEYQVFYLTSWSVR